MNDSTLPVAIRELLASTKSASEVLRHLLPMVGFSLQADRCFLYLRNPVTKRGKIAFCWCRDASIPDVTEPEWRFDPPIAQEDPLFAAALRAEPSRFIEDVETADPRIVNQDFEARTFGHRAFMHAHITHEGQLWGILQPCVFRNPRRWSKADRTWIETLLPQILPWIATYVREIGE